MLIREMISIYGSPVQIEWTGDYHGAEVRVCVTRVIDEEFRLSDRWRWSIARWSGPLFAERYPRGGWMRDSEVTEADATRTAFEVLRRMLETEATFAVDNSSPTAVRLTD